MQIKNFTHEWNALLLFRYNRLEIILLTHSSQLGEDNTKLVRHLHFRSEWPCYIVSVMLFWVISRNLLTIKHCLNNARQLFSGFISAEVSQISPVTSTRNYELVAVARKMATEQQHQSERPITFDTRCTSTFLVKNITGWLNLRYGLIMMAFWALRMRSF